MSIVISAVGIGVGACLTYGGIRKRRKYSGSFGESTPAEHFSELVWPYTALRIKLISNRGAISSELPKAPQVIPFSGEFEGTGFDIVLTVPGGRKWSDYAGREENIQTLLRVPRVMAAAPSNKGHQLHYRIYEVEPTDNLQQKWLWNPSLATNNASAIAFAMGQFDPVRIKANAHTMVVGISGAGKSSIATAIFMNLAADPTVEIWGLDSKRGGGDIMKWGHLCKRVAFAGGAAGALAMFQLIADFVAASEAQQSALPVGKSQWVPRGTPNLGPDDIEATEENPTRILFIDEYNILNSEISNFLGAKAKDSIKLMAEEVGYEGNPFTDLSSILQGSRSSNHWLWAIGQNPRADAWHGRSEFGQRIMLMMDSSTQGLFFKGRESDLEAAKRAWSSSVDGLAPAQWEKGKHAGYAMVSASDAEGNSLGWDKVRMYFAPADHMLKLRKAGLNGSPRVVNHEFGHSTPWSESVSATRVAVGLGDENLITNSPKEKAPSPEQLEFEELAAARAKDTQRPERAQWIFELLGDLKAAKEIDSYDKIVRILKAAKLNPEILRRDGASAKLWNEIKAVAFPEDGELPAFDEYEDDGAFSSVAVSEWEISVANGETITDEDELTEALSQLQEAQPRISSSTLKRIDQMMATELKLRGRTTYTSMAAKVQAITEREAV